MTAVYEAASNLLSYDPDKGHFVWKTNASKTVKGKVAGSKKRDGYVYIQFNGKKLSAHRLAWFVLNGSLPNNLVIDHIDGDGYNNKAINLRAVEHYVNLQNRRAATTQNKTGFLGVSKAKSGWKAQLHIKGKQIYCGTYPFPELAHQAYLAAKRIHHEGCTI